MSRPRRSLPGRLAVLLGSTLLALLALELAVRWLGPTFRPRSLDDKRLFTRFDPELGWANRADVTAVVSGPGYVHRATHSAAALRDREHARARTPGIRRVLVLGDSFVWGLGVADDEIFPRLLALHRSHIETIAMGTSGYGTDQELLWYSRDGAPYRPDLVVLALYLPNDARSNLGDRACSRRKPRFELVDGALRLTGTPVPRETR